MKALLLFLAALLALLACCRSGPPPQPLTDTMTAGADSSAPRDARRLDLTAPAEGTVAATPAMLPLQPGTFMMGSPVEEPCRRADESQHQVKLTRRFEIQSTEVTQGQFAALMGYVPLSSCGPPCPVVNVSWSEAAAYCNALSVKAKLEPCYACTGSGSAVACTVAPAYRASAKPIYTCPGYRLPTEAEWEFAYRAGTTTALYNGQFGATCATDPNAGKIGWYRANAGHDIHPVGLKPPNAWGLYDMAGNAIELVHDFYVENLGTAPVVDPVHEATPERWHMIRGGSFAEDADRMRAARRDHCDSSPTSSDIDIGFRVVRTLPQ